MTTCCQTVHKLQFFMCSKQDIVLVLPSDSVTTSDELLPDFPQSEEVPLVACQPKRGRPRKDKTVVIGTDNDGGSNVNLDKDRAIRERQLLSKQKRRTDPYYKMRESLREKLRMRWKRLDPEYREREREKDRLRRSKSRNHNAELRQRERERDRISKRYKRLQQNIHGAVLPVYMEHELTCDINEDVVVTATVEDSYQDSTDLDNDTESNLSLQV